MIVPILFCTVLRALMALALGLVGPAAATPAVPKAAPAAAAVLTHPASHVAPAATTPCDTALAYLHAHGNPIFEMRCAPGTLPGGLAAVTCWKATALGVSCLNGGIVVISQPSCAISYENEASNSWLNFSTLTGGAINGRARHDASGRTVDPFGECG